MLKRDNVKIGDPNSLLENERQAKGGVKPLANILTKTSRRHDEWKTKHKMWTTLCIKT